MVLQGRKVNSNPLARISISRISKHGGAAGLAFSVFVGLTLACSTMFSVHAAILVLCGGTLLALTLFLRQIDLLIYGWFILTGFILVITWHLMPQYSQLLGTAIFWGLLLCIMATWAMDNCLKGMKFVSFDNVPVKLTVLLFLFWGAICVYTSVDMNISIRRFSHIAIGVGASYMFYDFFSRDHKNIRKTVGIVFFMTLVVSVATIVTGVYSLSAGLPIYKQLGLWFMGSNAVGSLLCNSIPILVTAGLTLVPNKTLKAILVAVMLLALFFTFARSAWIGTLAAIGFILWRSRIHRFISLAMIVGLVVAAWLFPAVGADVYRYVTGGDYSYRQHIWKASWNMACDYPFFGVGPGNAMYLMSDYLVDPLYAELVGVEDTHSVYLKNAAEMGFASPVMWLAIFALFIYYSTRIERSLNSRFLRLAAMGSTATFIGLSVHGISENGFFMTPFVAAEYYAMLPYILFAIPFAAKKLEERQKQDDA